MGETLETFALKERPGKASREMCVSCPALTFEYSFSGTTPTALTCSCLAITKTG